MIKIRNHFFLNAQLNSKFLSHIKLKKDNLIKRTIASYRVSDMDRKGFFLFKWRRGNPPYGRIV